MKAIELTSGQGVQTDRRSSLAGHRSRLIDLCVLTNYHLVEPDIIDQADLTIAMISGLMEISDYSPGEKDAVNSDIDAFLSAQESGEDRVRVRFEGKGISFKSSVAAVQIKDRIDGLGKERLTQAAEQFLRTRARYMSAYAENEMIEESVVALW